jgi:predicted dehydrogenase
MNDPLRVGLIGCGNIALRSHAPALLQTAGVCVAGVADPVEARRAQVQSLLGLPEAACHADYRALLDMGLDYVVLTVPQRYRRPIVEACAEAGVHVLSEKPLATVPADAAAMIAAMRAANLRFGIMHNYLFYPEYVLVRQLVKDGQVGRLRHLALNFLGMPDHPGAAEYRPAWRKDPLESGGGVLMDMVHTVYVAEFLMDAPVREVSAAVDNLDHPGESVEDFSLVNLAFDNGYATINIWWGSGAGGLEVSGTDGRVMVFYDNFATGPFTTLDSVTLVNREGRQDLHPRREAPAYHNIDTVHADFAEAVRTGRDPVAPAEDGLRTLQAVLGAYTSAATGQVVALPFPEDHPVYQRGVYGLAELPGRADSPLRRRGLLGLNAAGG